MTTITVALPVHLRTLARIDGDLAVEVAGEPTTKAVLDVVESSYPMLRGTIREHGTLKRRAYMRYFADGQDISHEDPSRPLPEAVVSGREPLVVIGAISGG